MRSVRVRIPRPTRGWAHTALMLDRYISGVKENITLYVLLRRLREKAAGADRGDLVTQILPFEFSVEGATLLKTFVEGTPQREHQDFFAALYERLRDALDDYEEAELDRAEFARFRERAFPPAETVRERWGLEDGVQGTEESEQGADR